MELGDALRLLIDEDRRRLILELDQHNPVALSYFPAATTETERERTTTALYHTDLPMLETAGVIDWDRERQVVEKGPAFRDVAGVLTGIRESDATFAANES